MSVFSKIKASKPGRNVFNLSHEVKMSSQFGVMSPILVQEIIPGDKMRSSSEMLLRIAPQIAPVMHRCDIRTEFFFVPNRLVYEDWQEFITGGPDGTSILTPPYVEYGNPIGPQIFAEGSLADYMGIPPTPDPVSISEIKISALPFRAYQLINNEYYINQNVDTPWDIPLGGGNRASPTELNELFALRTCCFRKDYFTGSLPFTQRGNPVTLPLAGTAPLIYNSDVGRDNWTQVKPIDGATTLPALEPLSTVGSGTSVPILIGTDTTTGIAANIDVSGNTFADLSDISAVNLADLRDALALQRHLERGARSGSRYIEVIRSYFGVVSSDARLQRPEYLGGGVSPIHFTEVLQTSETDSSPQGNMAGHGYAHVRSHSFNRFFEEHGYVIGIARIVPRAAYQQGIARHFQKFDRFDYYWQDLAHLGEQPIYNSEIYAAPERDGNYDTFGYVPRYSEYRFNHDRVAGDFRSSLSYWHLSRIFESRPGLNSSFVHVNPADFQRIFAVTDPDIDKFYIYLANDIRMSRPIPYFGTPYTY